MSNGQYIRQSIRESIRQCAGQSTGQCAVRTIQNIFLSTELSTLNNLLDFEQSIE